MRDLFPLDVSFSRIVFVFLFICPYIYRRAGYYLSGVTKSLLLRLYLFDLIEVNSCPSINAGAHHAAALGVGFAACCYKLQKYQPIRSPDSGPTGQSGSGKCSQITHLVICIIEAAIRSRVGAE